MAYTYLAADLASGSLLAELPLLDVKWTRALNGSGPITARLQMLPPTAANAQRNALLKAVTDRKTKAIYVLRDGVPMGAWEIHSRRKMFGTHEVELRGAELFSYFYERLFGNGGTAALRSQLVSHTGTPIAVAVAILATRAADIGLDLSAVDPPAGPTITYEGRRNDGKKVGEIIADLSKGEGDLGFDYRVDLAGQAPNFVRRLIMSPVVGADVGLIAKLTRPDGRGNIAEGSIVEDERRASHVTALGKGDGVAKATAEAIGTAFAPQSSTVVAWSEETDTAILQARATAKLRALENISIPELTLRSDQLDAQLGTFAPGDVGQVVIEPGADPWYPDGAWLDQRVVEFDVNVPDSHDNETVTFRFDDPVGEF